MENGSSGGACLDICRCRKTISKGWGSQGDARARSRALLGDRGRQQWRSLSRYLQISAVISSSVQHAPKPFGRADWLRHCRRPQTLDRRWLYWCLVMYVCLCVACMLVCLLVCLPVGLVVCLPGRFLRVWGLLGASWEPFGGFLGSPGGLLGASWGLLGAF